MKTRGKRLELSESTKMLSDWAERNDRSAKEYAKSMPSGTTQEATALMFVKALEDFVTIEEEMQRLHVRFFAAVEAMKICGAALESEFGEQFLSRVPSPGILEVQEQSEDCDCPRCKARRIKLN
jgi:hypothetical protein